MSIAPPEAKSRGLPLPGGSGLSGQPHTEVGRPAPKRFEAAPLNSVSVLSLDTIREATQVVPFPPASNASKRELSQSLSATASLFRNATKSPPAAEAPALQATAKPVFVSIRINFT